MINGGLYLLPVKTNRQTVISPIPSRHLLYEHLLQCKRAESWLENVSSLNAISPHGSKDMVSAYTSELKYEVHT